MSLLSKLIRSRCALCLQLGARGALCEDCQLAATPRQPLCRRCALPLLAGQNDPLLCGSCRSHPPAFERAHTAWLYTPPWDGLVLMFKKGRDHHLASDAAHALVRHSDPEWPDCFIAVPANAYSLQERGFSPAAEFARVLAKRAGRPLSLNRVTRTPDRVRQHDRSRVARESAMITSFSIGRCRPVQTLEHIGVVDDVLTTGSTLDAVARLLLQNGQAARVSVWVMARTPE